MMNRRGFLGAFLGAVAGATLDPERALWKPGKLISIPKPAGVSIRYIRAFDISQLKIISRFDVLYGMGENFRPLENAPIGHGIECSAVVHGENFDACLNNLRAMGAANKMRMELPLPLDILDDLRKPTPEWRCVVMS